MGFIPSNRQSPAEAFGQGWNATMNLFGQKMIAEREKRMEDQFNKQFKSQEDKYAADAKVRSLQYKSAQEQLKSLEFENKLSEKKAKLWENQQKNIQAYKDEVSKARESGTLDSKTHMQIRNKYISEIEGLADIKEAYAETADEKRAKDLTAKKDFFDYEHNADQTPQEKEDMKLKYAKQLEDYKTANKTPTTPMAWYFQENKGKGLTLEKVVEFDKMLKGEGANTPFKAFSQGAKMYGKDPGEIARAWHDERKKDLIEVSEARYPTRQQIPDIPGMTFDRRTGEYLMPGGIPVAPEDFGLIWAGKYQMAADKSALREVTKRNELVKSFAKRIEVNSPIVAELGKRVGNTNIKLLNAPINDLWKQGVIGDGDLAAYKLAVTSLSNEIAKVESSSLGIAGVSVEQMQIMSAIHNTNIPIAEFQKVIDVGIRLSQTLEGALESQRIEILERIKNWTPEEKRADSINDEFDIKVK